MQETMKTEIERGQALASEVVDHLQKIGGAATALFDVIRDGRTYRVTLTAALDVGSTTSEARPAT